MTSRKQPGVAFRATVVAVVVLVAYPLSFGPACWWFATSEDFGDGVVDECAPRLYWPIGWLGRNGPERLKNAVNWYATIGVEHVVLPTDPRGVVWYGAFRSIR
jgi:hypothetical protein